MKKKYYIKSLITGGIIEVDGKKAHVGKEFVEELGRVGWNFLEIVSQEEYEANHRTIGTYHGGVNPLD